MCMMINVLHNGYRYNRYYIYTYIYIYLYIYIHIYIYLYLGELILLGSMMDIMVVWPSMVVSMVFFSRMNQSGLGFEKSVLGGISIHKGRPKIQSQTQYKLRTPLAWHGLLPYSSHRDHGTDSALFVVGCIDGFTLSLRKWSKKYGAVNQPEIGSPKKDKKGRTNLWIPGGFGQWSKIPKQPLFQKGVYGSNQSQSLWDESNRLGFLNIHSPGHEGLLSECFWYPEMTMGKFGQINRFRVIPRFFVKSMLISLSEQPQVLHWAGGGCPHRGVPWKKNMPRYKGVSSLRSGPSPLYEPKKNICRYQMSRVQNPGWWSEGSVLAKKQYVYIYIYLSIYIHTCKYSVYIYIYRCVCVGDFKHPRTGNPDVLSSKVSDAMHKDVCFSTSSTNSQYSTYYWRLKSVEWQASKPWASRMTCIYSCIY